MTARFDPVSFDEPGAHAYSTASKASSPFDHASILRTVGDFVALTKPRITLMVMATMLGGMWIAVRDGYGAISSQSALVALVATAAVVGSANTLNMYLERRTDGLMARTRNRPLPQGRLSAHAALAFGIVLALVAVPMLVLAVNWVTGALAAFALVSYVCAYTPLKRKTSLALLVGAVPGAIPPLLGWTATTGRVGLPGLSLFGILFFWQLPHFLAIATFRRDDYARAGIKALPVVRGDETTRRHIILYAAALVAATLAPVPLGMGGRLYWASALVLGALFFALGLWGLRRSAGQRWARGLFAASIVYLLLLLSALMVSQA